MDYKIIAADASTGQIQVSYAHEGNDLAVFSIDVPIVDGAFLTGEALDNEIQCRAPTWLVQRKNELSVATGFDQIVALVAAPTVLDLQASPWTPTNPEILKDVQLKVAIQAALDEMNGTTV